jgi:hypothetical protein
MPCKRHQRQQRRMGLGPEQRLPICRSTRMCKRFCTQRMGAVFGFKLGNELRHEGKTKNMTRMVQGLPGIMGQMVDKIWEGLSLAGNVGIYVCWLRPPNSRHLCLLPKCQKCWPDTSTTFCYVWPFFLPTKSCRGRLLPTQSLTKT